MGLGEVTSRLWLYKRMQTIIISPGLAVDHEHSLVSFCITFHSLQILEVKKLSIAPCLDVMRTTECITFPHSVCLWGNTF